MNTVDKLITQIKELSASKYIKKESKDFIKENLKLIKEHANNQENKHINTIINVINNSQINKSDRDKIKIIKTPIINIIRKYEEEFNDEENDDDIEENLTVEEVEKIIDAKIPCYNKFDENHPMKGVTWDKSSKRYKIQFGNISTNIKNLSDACNKIMEKFKHKQILKNYTKSILKNNQCKLIEYIHDKNKYYDIKHILYYISLKKSSTNEKYTSVKNNIVAIIWFKNSYGGYIMRELINIDTVKLLIKSTVNPSVINLIKLLEVKLMDYVIPRKETTHINNIMKVFYKEKMITQKYVQEYKIDLYFPKYKLAIECDEFNHINRNINYEIKRQKYIETTLNCIFIRFNPDDPNFDIFKVISDIHYHMHNYT